MIFPVNSIIHFIGENLGLKKGDIIFTGTPEGVAPLRDDDVIILRWGDEQLGSIAVGR